MLANFSVSNDLSDLKRDFPRESDFVSFEDYFLKHIRISYSQQLAVSCVYFAVLLVFTVDYQRYFYSNRWIPDEASLLLHCTAQSG